MSNGLVRCSPFCALSLSQVYHRRRNAMPHHHDARFASSARTRAVALEQHDGHLEQRGVDTAAAPIDTAAYSTAAGTATATGRHRLTPTCAVKRCRPPLARGVGYRKHIVRGRRRLLRLASGIPGIARPWPTCSAKVDAACTTSRSSRTNTEAINNCWHCEPAIGWRSWQHSQQRW